MTAPTPAHRSAEEKKPESTRTQYQPPLIHPRLTIWEKDLCTKVPTNTATIRPGDAMPPPRHTGHAGNPRPHGPGGINIRDHADKRGRRHDSRDNGGKKRPPYPDGRKNNRDDKRPKDDKEGGSRKEGRGD